MKLLHDMGLVESRIGPFGYGVIVGIWCTICAKHTMAQKLFWTHPMVLLGDEAQVEAQLGPFGDSTNLEAR
jgi:hypothetical protein